ncbi:response regulator [Leptospira ognonensis]|uniref:Response regulator n=1 Tax=Leptospira ognonensis TaxID=2484945 RepID=A0A4R9JXH9_9LEPT|nr:response regulator [Leptospira ognonensis]TGL57907.1 response regulator [Leptospira ognonensis]
MNELESFEDLLKEAKGSKENHTKDVRLIKVIMVDDIKSISSAMKREIMNIVRNTEGIRFHITDIQDPEAALAYIKTHKPDLLISDIKMPFLTGDKLIEEVKKTFPELPIIVVTGFATKENIVSVYKSDKNCIILSKPWEAERLVAALNKLLNLNIAWED